MRGTVPGLWFACALCGTACVSPDPVRLDAVQIAGGVRVPEPQDPAAQDAAEPEPPPQDPVSSDGLPRPRITDGATDDWIRLDSGEWLRGKFERLRQDNVEFDSEALDMLKLDWADIEAIRSLRRWRIQSVDGEIYEGPLSLADGIVTIGDPTDGGRSFSRDDVLSIVESRERFRDFWSGKASFSLTARSGNTDQTDYTTYLEITRETILTRWDSNFRGALSEVQGVRTTENDRLKSRFDVFLTERLFLTPVGLDVYRDPFQNIALRVTAFTGVGYEVIDGDDVDWFVSGGPAYLLERADSVSQGQDDTNEALAAVLASKFAWDVTPDIEYSLNYDITLSFQDSATFNHHLASILSLDLIDDFDLDVQFIWDRIQDPEPGTDGVIPERDDFRMSVGLGYSF